MINDGTTNDGANSNIDDKYAREKTDVKPVDRIVDIAVLAKLDTYPTLVVKSPEEYFLKKFVGKDNTLIILKL